MKGRKGSKWISKKKGEKEAREGKILGKARKVFLAAGSSLCLENPDILQKCPVFFLQFCIPEQIPHLAWLSYSIKSKIIEKCGLKGI